MPFDRFTYYKEQYDKELALREDINKSLGQYVQIIVLMFGLAAYLGSHLNFTERWGTWTMSWIATITFSIIGLALLLVSVGLLISIFWPHRWWSDSYALAPSPKEVESIYESIMKGLKDTEAEVETDEEQDNSDSTLSEQELHKQVIIELESMMLDAFQAFATHNMAVNQKKNARLFQAKGFLTGSILTLTFAAIFTFLFV